MIAYSALAAVYDALTGDVPYEQWAVFAQKAFAKAAQLSQDATEEERQEAQLSVMDLEIFENVAFIMARQYDQNIPDTVDAWLDQFETFSIYEIFPEILSLWNMNNKTTSKPKKN